LHIKRESDGRRTRPPHKRAHARQRELQPPRPHCPPLRRPASLARPPAAPPRIALASKGKGRGAKQARADVCVCVCVCVCAAEICVQRGPARLPHGSSARRSRERSAACAVAAACGLRRVPGTRRGASGLACSRDTHSRMPRLRTSTSAVQSPWSDVSRATVRGPRCI
jgi:hypothetical protein